MKEFYIIMNNGEEIIKSLTVKVKSVSELQDSLGKGESLLPLDLKGEKFFVMKGGDIVGRATLIN